MSDGLLRAIGWRALLLHGDPCVLDRWLWVRRHLRSGPVRTLDAGFGNGAFSIYAARQGNEVVALSFSAQERDEARARADHLGVDGVSFGVLDLREFGSRAEEYGTFDQIICLETIEHLIDDEGVVAELAAVLRPGGQLLLSAPSAEHHALYKEHLSESEDGGHVRWGYTHDRLREILEQAGLEPAHAGGVSGVVSQRVTNLMRRLERVDRRLAWLLTAPLRALVIVDRPLTLALKYPFLSVTAVGVRPAEPGAEAG